MPGGPLGAPGLPVKWERKPSWPPGGEGWACWPLKEEEGLWWPSSEVLPGSQSQQLDLWRLTEQLSPREVTGPDALEKRRGKGVLA